MALAMNADEEKRSRQLLRTVTSGALQASASDLWVYPDPNAVVEPPPNPKDVKAGKGAPPVEEIPPLEAECDPDAGGLFLSHVWEMPESWAMWFGTGRFQDAKRLQINSALQRANKANEETDTCLEQVAAESDRDNHVEENRVWVDCASLPDAIEKRDHPLDELILGIYAMPVKELRNLLPKVDIEGGYTVLHLAEEGYHFEGTMGTRDWDEHGRPMERVTQQQIQWDIPPGWYHVRSAQVIPEGKLSPLEANNKAPFKPIVEQMRKWTYDLRLRDEVWVEFTLGSIRAECMLLAEPMMTLYSGLLAVFSWNYFDRLWPLVEWAMFCARRGPEHVLLAADLFVGPALVEYQRAFRRISVNNAGVRDSRDRDLLLGMLTRTFKCGYKEVTEGYAKPGVGKQPEPVRVVITDYSAIERYAQATAIAIFAHENAPAATRKPGAGDEAGWAVLAGELGLEQLQIALRKCKPFDWAEAVACKPEEEQDDAFHSFVEEWWTRLVLPVLEDERKLAMGLSGK